MKKVIVTELEKETVLLEHVAKNEPIFLVRNGIIEGLVVEEKEGWIVRIGGVTGYAGFHRTRKIAILKTLGNNPNLKFYIRPTICTKEDK